MKKITTLISAVAMGVALSGAVNAEETLKMGTEGAYPPFNSVDKDGKLVGFDIEIGDALCTAMGTKCEWVTSDWDGIIPALQAKKFDTIVASMSITDERKKQIDFSGKYYTTPIMCMRAIGTDADPSDDAKLKGKIVGVQSGVVAENFVTGAFGDKVEVKAYGTQDEANLDLLSGRVDLICADSVVIAPFVEDKKNAGKVEFVGPSYTDEKFVGAGIGVGIRKGEDALREKLNKAIMQIRADGTYAKINKKYFDFDLYGE